ncbi:MAG: hypothetical protein MR902_01960, partial [Campylobacter sp.]|nr:hypothetical protein [Campylobacter sp.]
MRFDKFATSANGKIYYNDSGKIKKVEFLSQNLSKPLDDIWLNFCDEAKQSKFDDTKTNEVLLQTIIISSTNKNDIVMDFTLKSPISVSVAHRINRQYIGISKNTKPTIQRLQSVIDGEQ